MPQKQGAPKTADSALRAFLAGRTQQTMRSLIWTRCGPRTLPLAPIQWCVMPIVGPSATTCALASFECWSQQWKASFVAFLRVAPLFRKGVSDSRKLLPVASRAVPAQPKSSRRGARGCRRDQQEAGSGFRKLQAWIRTYQLLSAVFRRPSKLRS